MFESDATTRGVRVQVRSVFVPERSSPEQGQWFFAYQIVITNSNAEQVQLLTRHWIITDGNGSEEEVKGPGVVGEQPRLNPGEAFRYTSGAVLETAVGTMEGHYEFRGDDGDLFKVAIPPFSLAVPNAVH